MNIKNIIIAIVFLVLIILAGKFFYHEKGVMEEGRSNPVNQEKIIPAPSNTEIRAGIDIGSGATNLKVARVDPKTHKIVEILFTESLAVPYQKHMEKSDDMTFDKEVMNQGLKVMQTYKEIADRYKVQKVVAVATAAFREAKNAPEFAKAIENQTGIHVTIVDHDLEGILAFEAAMAAGNLNPEQSIVWDIGGGSVQLTGMNENGQFIVQKGTLASIPFKNALIQQIQAKDSKVIHSPNPVSQEQMDRSFAYIKKNTGTVNPFIAKEIQNPDTKIFAVGSLFNFAIKPLLNGTDVITQDALEKGITPLLNKTDAELGEGHFTEIAVSNPILILGYMKALDIDHVTIIDVNNTDGVLIYPAFWE